MKWNSGSVQVGDIVAFMQHAECLGGTSEVTFDRGLSWYLSERFRHSDSEGRLPKAEVAERPELKQRSIQLGRSARG